jgi:hypothetical protein
MPHIVSFPWRILRKSRVTPANPETLPNLPIPATKQAQYRQVGMSEIFFTVGADRGVGRRVEQIGFKGGGLSVASPRGLISNIWWMEDCGS